MLFYLKILFWYLLGSVCKFFGPKCLYFYVYLLDRKIELLQDYVAELYLIDAKFSPEDHFLLSYSNCDCKDGDCSCEEK